jgi:hypothetical protein
MRTTLAVTAVVALLCSTALEARAICGDVNESETVTSSDALAVLREAVGQDANLTCDICGSDCPGDPLFLIGDWVFESDFGDVFVDEYELFAVDDFNCEIIGQDFDDGSVVYAYAGEEYDYILLDPDDGTCDLFVFDVVNFNEVEGTDFLLDVDLDGACDLDAVLDEGPMIGERVTTAMAARVSAEGTSKRSASMAGTSKSIASERPGLEALLAHVKERYATHKRPER